MAQAIDEVISTTTKALPSTDIEQLGSTVQASPIALVFTSFDDNHDKYVDATELAVGTAREWASMSPSFSGNVGAIKFEDWMIETLGASDTYPSRLSFDSNLNSQVSKSEFEARLSLTFMALDTDEDGQLSRKELTFRAARRGAKVENSRPSERE